MRLVERREVPHDYQARFAEALLTFRHQWVYCPKQVSVPPGCGPTVVRQQ